MNDQAEATGARSINTDSKDKILSGDGSRLATAEQRLRQLGINLSAPPEPFGIYAEAVQTGILLFLTGMLPTMGREAKFIGRIGAELDLQAGRAMPLTWQRSTPSMSRGSIWDRSTKLRGSSGSACWWPLRAMSGSSRKSLTRFRVAPGRFRERQEPCPIGVRRSQSSARRAGRAGVDF